MFYQFDFVSHYKRHCVEKCDVLL